MNIMALYYFMKYKTVTERKVSVRPKGRADSHFFIIFFEGYDKKETFYSYNREGDTSTRPRL